MLPVKRKNIVEMQTVQWINGRENAGSDGVDSENLGAKRGGDESVVKIGISQLNVQGLELEQ